MTAKRPYCKPQLIRHGNVEVLTQASKFGTKLDAPYQAGTPGSSITFS